MSDNENRNDRDPVDVEHAAEDILGFNFRSLRTLRDLFLRPDRVFAAYAKGARGEYTPALRLWLGIVGVQFLASFFFGGFTGLAEQQFESFSPEQAADLEAQMGYGVEEYSERFGSAAQMLYTPLLAIFTALVAFIPGLIGNGISWHARVNITFSILSFSSIFGLLLMPVTFHFQQLFWLSIVVVFSAYLTCHLRGTPGLPNYDGSRRYLRAAGFSAMTVLMTMLAGMFMGIGAATYAMWPAIASIGNSAGG